MPSAPSFKPFSISAPTPMNTEKSFFPPNRCSSSSCRFGLFSESLMPASFGWPSSFSTASSGIETPVVMGMLYSSSGPSSRASKAWNQSCNLSGATFSRMGGCARLKKFVRLRQIRQLHVAKAGKNLRASCGALDGQLDETAAEPVRHMNAFAGRAEHKNPFDAACHLCVHQAFQRRLIQPAGRGEWCDQWHHGTVIF